MSVSGGRSFSCRPAMTMMTMLMPAAMNRVLWTLTLLLIMSLVTQNLVAPFTFVLAQEFEGFLEDMGDGEDAEMDSPPFPIPVARSQHQEPSSRTAASTSSSSSSSSSSRNPNPDPGAAAAAAATGSVRSGKRNEAENRKGMDPHEFWDEDEFEGLPVKLGEKESPSSPSSPSSSAVQDEKIDSKQNKRSSKSYVLKPPQNYYMEGACVVFLLIYGTVYWLGKKENERIALAWASQFVSKDSIFEKNFSLLGTGDGPDDPLLVKEGQNVFKFYASGRRYCEGLLATMEFQARHDLLSRAWYLVSPGKDELNIDVYMNDENMEPIVFAITRRKQGKEMLKECKDLQQFASMLSPPTGPRKWVAEELVVISESREIAVDLLTDGLLEQVFGKKAFQTVAPYFVSLHFSDQQAVGLHKKLLQFKFLIPPAERMADMARLISIVPYFIDAIGRYKLSAPARTKASGVRAKLDQENAKELAKARQEALQKKKMERETQLSSKQEEKERLRQLKKSMPKVKMSRGH
jgi:hypothetical protein